MKLSRIYYLLILAVVTSLTSCDSDDDIYPQLGEDPRNLDQIISDTPELSTLNQALVQVSLDSVLRSTTTYTVFAPSNSAFDGVDTSEMTDEELENLLLNHVVNTVTADFASTLSTGYRTTMATGPEGNFLSLFINAEEGNARLNDMASLNSSNGTGSTNGVLHIIDGVLVPPTVDDHVKANPEFSMLAEAIELAGLEETLAANDEESEAYPLTLYAPTNAAFEDFMMQLNGAFGWSTLSEIPVDVLTQILTYHLVTGENTVSAVIADTEQTTVQGDIFNVNAESVITDGSYSTTNFTLTDVQGVNGVMHGIDKVLIPADIFQDILDATQNLKERSEDRGFTTFLAAMEKAGLTHMLEGEDMLTVFAPNNAAFDGLFATVENFETLEDFDTEEEIEVLRDLLTYHIHEGVLMSSQLTNGGTITTVQGDEITADLSGENARLRPSYQEALPSVIVMANIGATNGIIHEINRVLVPAGFENTLGFPSDEGGVCPVGDESLVFFDWNGKNPYWGNIQPEDGALSLDGTAYGRANFQTGGTGWTDLFWRNGGTLNGAEIVGDNLTGYSLKFDINVQEPISAGMFRIRFNNSSGVDAFYNWAPWEETGEPFSTDGWETIEIPLTALGQPDFSLVDAEFGMAFEGADVLLNFAIDNVRFDTPGGCAGPDPVANPDAVFFDWDENGSWWGQAAAENDPAISLDGTNYGRVNFQTGGTGWQDLFWRNDASTFHGADMVGTNVDDYVLKFDIVTFEPISEGMFRIRFNASSGVDAFYAWQPWEETGEPFHTEGEWVTVTIPVSALGQPDFSAVDAEFGMAFEGADTLLNFAIDNVRFEEK